MVAVLEKSGGEIFFCVLCLRLFCISASQPACLPAFLCEVVGSVSAFMTTMGSTNWFTCGAMAKITPLRVRREVRSGQSREERSEGEAPIVLSPPIVSLIYPCIILASLSISRMPHSHYGTFYSALAFKQLDSTHCNFP